MEALYRDLGYVDGFRRVSSDPDEFTYWPGGDRASGGQRTDVQVLSNGLRNRVEYGLIYKNQTFSSHAPVIMDYEFELD